MPDVRVKDLWVGIGTRTVLGPLSFTVNRNTTMAIVGPGGSGKSTLLKALARRLPADMWMRGEFFVKPEPVAFLTQNSNVESEEESLSESFVPSSRRMVEPGLRIAHFRAVLALNARILLLDEPEARLPESYYDHVEQELIRIRGRKTVILVSHNLSLVERISDWMMLLIDGEVIEQGETARLFSSPAKQRTLQFIRLGS